LALPSSRWTPTVIACAFLHRPGNKTTAHDYHVSSGRPAATTFSMALLL
jgi:hypothetical protein